MSQLQKKQSKSLFSQIVASDVLSAQYRFSLLKLL